MDKLEKMFAMQKELQKTLGAELKFKNKTERQYFINMMMLACIEELIEANRNTMWKSKKLKYGWKKHIEFDEKKYKKELIDTWHFFMNLWLVVGGTAEEFYRMYKEKLAENHQRKLRDY